MGSVLQARTPKRRSCGSCAEAVLGEGLSFSGTLDFFTYFNACSLAKWKRYAQIEEVTLELVVDDLNCVIGWVGRSEGDAATQALVSGSRLSYFAHEETEQGLYRVTVPVPKTDKQVVGFVLQAREAICLKRGVYYTMVDESQVNPVVLALCTTTFKKEDYIIPNIEMVKEEIIASDEPIASHFQMFVIDNGQTLDGEALSTDQVHVIPNKNVGGIGRIRSLHDGSDGKAMPGVTHVLLMDDDVSVSTEPSSARSTCCLCARASILMHSSMVPCCRSKNRIACSKTCPM